MEPLLQPLLENPGDPDTLRVLSDAHLASESIRQGPQRGDPAGSDRLTSLTSISVGTRVWFD